jgi:hypothetical protein
MLSAIFSQLKLPFASGANHPSRQSKQSSAKGLRAHTPAYDAVQHADFQSSMAFAHSCYDPDADLVKHAKSSDTAMACALLKDLDHPKLRSPSGKSFA